MTTDFYEDEIVEHFRPVPLAEARRVAKEVADHLRRDYGATRVILYGSAARGHYDPEHSDIDIYYEGVPRKNEFIAASEMEMKYLDYHWDFRPAPYCFDYFRDEVYRTGIEL